MEMSEIQRTLSGQLQGCINCETCNFASTKHEQQRAFDCAPLCSHTACSAHIPAAIHGSARSVRSLKVSSSAACGSLMTARLLCMWRASMHRSCRIMCACYKQQPTAARSSGTPLRHHQQPSRRAPTCRPSCGATAPGPQLLPGTQQMCNPFPRWLAGLLQTLILILNVCISAEMSSIRL